MRVQNSPGNCRAGTWDALNRAEPSETPKACLNQRHGDPWQSSISQPTTRPGRSRARIAASRCGGHLPAGCPTESSSAISAENSPISARSAAHRPSATRSFFGQGEMERGAGADRALGPDSPAMRFDNPESDIEPRPSPVRSPDPAAESARRSTLSRPPGFPPPYQTQTPGTTRRRARRAAGSHRPQV